MVDTDATLFPAVARELAMHEQDAVKEPPTREDLVTTLDSSQSEAFGPASPSMMTDAKFEPLVELTLATVDVDTTKLPPVRLESIRSVWPARGLHGSHHEAHHEG